MDWIMHGGVLVATLVVIFTPGLLIGIFFGVRGLALWALAPVVSTATLSVLAILFGATRIAWTPASVGVASLVIAVLAWAVSIAFGLRRRPSAPHHGSAIIPLAVGLAVGMGLGATRIAFYISNPEAISQTNDAVFHLNVLRFITERGSASSFDISELIDSSAFYPGAWHAIASLVALLGGTSFPVAVNMVSLVIGVAVWTLGITWLAREATNANVVATAFAAALSPFLLTFPLLMLEWGVLYPYALSIALVPAAVSAVIVAPRWTGGAGPFTRTAGNVTLGIAAILAGVVAIAFAQPASLLTWAVLVVTWFSGWTIIRIRQSGATRRMFVVFSLTCVWLAFVALWLFLTNATSGAVWAPFGSKRMALVDVVLNGQVMLPFAVGISILMIVGVVVAARQPALRWLAASWVVFAGLYAVSAAITYPFARQWLLGAWYGDPYRLAAVAPVAVIPLAAIGLAAVTTWAAEAVSSQRELGARRAVTWGLVAISLVGTASIVVAPVVQMPKVFESGRDTETRYESTRESFLSIDERTLLERLDETVPPGARIVGNPSTGVGFAYVLSGVDVYPRTWSLPRSEEFAILTGGLRGAADDPRVCAALDSIGAEYVLDFGVGEMTPGRYVFPEMSGFEGREGFELVDTEGDASLWRVTACD